MNNMIFVKMNKLTIIIFFLIIISCGRAEEKNDSKQDEILSKNEETMIVGTWTCCKCGMVSSIINLNECLVFRFNCDYSGYYLIPSGEKTLFEWRMINISSIDIEFEQTNNEILKNGRYKIERDELAQGHESQLIITSKEWSYFLIANAISVDN